MAMVIVVLDHTKITKRIIKLSGKLTKSAFNSAFTKIKGKCIGLRKRQISKLLGNDMTPLENLLLREIFSVMSLEEKELGSDHYIYGLRNILAQPEFSDGSKGYSIVEAVEDGSLADAIVSQSSKLGVLQIRIGRENKGNFLWPLSVIIAEYGIVGESVGLLGVIGPTRMDYTKAITIVNEASIVMSQMVKEVR
jgi:heat-inducible transcriptional repressor